MSEQKKKSEFRLDKELDFKLDPEQEFRFEVENDEKVISTFYIILKFTDF